MGGWVSAPGEQISGTPVNVRKRVKFFLSVTKSLEIFV